MARSEAVEIEVGPHTVRLSSPDRVYFPQVGLTKRDVFDYYLAVGDGIVNALRERPCMLHRYPTGAEGDKVHQKRVPSGAPPWIETVRVFFPRHQRTAAGIDDAVFDITPLLEWADRDEAAGLEPIGEEPPEPR